MNGRACTCWRLTDGQHEPGCDIAQHVHLWDLGMPVMRAEDDHPYTLYSPRNDNPLWQGSCECSCGMSAWLTGGLLHPGAEPRRNRPERKAWGLIDGAIERPYLAAHPEREIAAERGGSGRCAACQTTYVPWWGLQVAAAKQAASAWAQQHNRQEHPRRAARQRAAVD